MPNIIWDYLKKINNAFIFNIYFIPIISSLNYFN